MTINIDIPEGLRKWVGLVKPAGRRLLFSAVGNAVSKLINDHLKRIAPTHHKTAERLGATPTGHLEPRTSFASDESSATVIIPIPGINRAFKDLSIAPKNAPYLTLPISSVSYGKRAATVRGLGYMIFRPAAKGAHKNAQGVFSAYQDLLMGTKDGETIPLYLLKKRVDQKQDPTLLPTQDEIGTTAARSMIRTINHFAKGAA